MATTYRIHPAIGIARVGNSPNDFFIGPERPSEFLDPDGGFKDDQCRVKRQAARFRVYANHDDGSTSELTAADAEISWTVHLANNKAAYPGRGNSAGQLKIDPGLRTLATPNGRALFDTGTITFTGQPTVTVPLGEIRTDDDGHLLVLGGSGHSASPAGNGIANFWASVGWFDDVSDGPVTASITLHGGGVHSAEGAWVIVAPPKYAPHQDSITSLYDRILQQMIDSNLVPAPATTSYTADIYPILQRARDMAWVEGTVANHNWSHPITQQAAIDAVVNRVTNPAGGGGNMPPLWGADRTVTPTQFAHLLRWKNGQYVNDWVGVPEPPAGVSPDGSDRAALDACVGGAFYPGIEAGGRSLGERPILEKPYSAPFRLDHSQVFAGDISASMALPWQADFKACADQWWPVPRPNRVLTGPGGPTVRWDRNVGSMDEMVNEWSSLGFVVKQGNEHIETQHCDEKSLVLLTPHLNFFDVGQGPMGMIRQAPLAIEFEVVSPSAAVTIDYAPGGAPSHPQLTPITTSVTVGPTAGGTVTTARLWLVYSTGTAGTAIPTQTVTVREPSSAKTWKVTIDANTVERTTTAVAVAVDRSGSMSEDRGDGQPKHLSMRQATNLFVDMMLEGDGVGLVRFDHDAQPLLPVRTLGNGQITDTNRSDSHDAINGNALDPAGGTSIGDGIFEARNLLGVAAGYQRKALIVLTDGVENNERWIRDVSAQIDATTYAIGIGRPENISVPALQTISGNTGGYVLVTGPIVGDNRFRLQKQFLQILAGVNNAAVVLDPEGTIGSGDVVSVPFTVSDADSGIEVVLLTPFPNIVDFRLRTPTGQLIEPWLAQNNPGMQFAFSDGAAWFRLSVPVQLQQGRFDQSGTWQALLTLGRPRVGPDHQEIDPTILLSRSERRIDGGSWSIDRSFAEMSESERRFRSRADNAASRRLPYSLIVNSYSSLSFSARSTQTDYAPGARVGLSARLTESGVAVGDATVWAEFTTPQGSSTRLDLAPTALDTWGADFVAREAGVYHGRVRARGRTRSGLPFTREHAVTAVSWFGAGRPDDPATSVPGGRPGDSGSGKDWCELLECVGKGAIDERGRKRLAEWGIDTDRLLDCISHTVCRDRDSNQDRR